MVSARQGPVFARILVVPATRDGLGLFYQDVIAVSPLEPWDAASAAYRLEILARTLPFPVDGARLAPSNNNDVWRLEHGYLRVAWRGDRSRLAREAELLGRLQGFLPVPEVLDGGGDDRLSWSRRPGCRGLLMSTYACSLRLSGCETSRGKWPRCCGRCIHGQCPETLSTC